MAREVEHRHILRYAGAAGGWPLYREENASNALDSVMIEGAEAMAP